jgi:hypothetical protein
MRWFSSVIFVVAATGSAVADDTTALDNMLGPREIGVGEAMRGGATGSTAIGLNPAGLPLNRELVFEGGYGYRPVDSASLIGVSACDSTNLMPGCFFYNYAGAEPVIGGMTGTRRMHVGGLALSRQFVPRVMVGLTTKYYDFESTMIGEKNASGFATDLGAVVRVTSMINFGIAVQNVYAQEKSTQFPRTVGGGLLARPMGALALSFDARWKLDGETAARYGGGLEYFLKARQNGFPIRLGALHDNEFDTTYVSAGLGMASMKWGLDVGGRRQVKGGDEMMVIASMRFFGPRMTAPSLDTEPGFH